MLSVPIEVICSIIDRAREFHSQEGVVFPDTPFYPSEDYDWLQVLASHQDDMTYQELQSIINDLELDQKIELLAIFLIGRGDFDSTEWSDACHTAGEILTQNLAEYLLSKPMLPTDLEEGLDQFGYACE